jgi:hypothetical protein
VASLCRVQRSFPFARNSPRTPDNDIDSLARYFLPTPAGSALACKSSSHSNAQAKIEQCHSARATKVAAALDATVESFRCAPSTLTSVHAGNCKTVARWPLHNSLQQCREKKNFAEQRRSTYPCLLAIGWSHEVPIYRPADQRPRPDRGYAASH